MEPFAIFGFILLSPPIYWEYITRKEMSICQREKKRIVKKPKEAIPNMSEFGNGYILGKTESFSENKPDDSDQKESKKGA